MQCVTVRLPDPLFDELKTAASEAAREMTYTAETYIQELVEAEMASRRIQRVRLPITPAEACARKPVELPEELEE